MNSVPLRQAFSEPLILSIPLLQVESLVPSRRYTLDQGCVGSYLVSINLPLILIPLTHSHAWTPTRRSRSPRRESDGHRYRCEAPVRTTWRGRDRSRRNALVVDIVGKLVDNDGPVDDTRGLAGLHIVGAEAVDIAVVVDQDVLWTLVVVFGFLRTAYAHMLSWW